MSAVRWTLVTAGVALTSIMLAVGVPRAAARGSLAQAAEVGPAAPSQPLQLVLPLIADDAGMERAALAVTTLGSPDYARYESLSQLQRRFGASASTRSRVVRYLRDHGATVVKIDATGLFADATISVAAAERLFGTELDRFRAHDGTRFVAPSDASVATVGARVPAALRGLVVGVVGLDTRPLASPATAQPVAHAATAPPSSELPYSGMPSGCAAGLAVGAYTPIQYLTAFDFGPLRGAGVDGQGVRVALIEGDGGFDAGDVHTFAQCFGLSVPPIETFRNGVAPPPAALEATLDLELVDATAPALKEIDVYESSDDEASALESMTAPLDNVGHQPQIVSDSSGLCEAQLVRAISRADLDAVEAALAETSAAGITYLTGSGDSGSECGADEPGAEYPASSPWVTGVGGTSFELNGANQITDQVVWNDDGGSGGGLSELFNRPNYQDGAEPADHRAVPDVSMLADEDPGITVYCSGVDCELSTPWGAAGGTSAAAPMLAGGFALVDQQLAAAGREPLGLVNPLLYALGESGSAASVFDDVTTGNDDPFYPGDPNGAPLGCCTAGVGYDDATGWGSVNIATFARAAVADQPPIVHISLSLPTHQRVIASGAIKATVSCSSACELGAIAQVYVGRARPFELPTKPFDLAAAGQRTLALRFSRAQLGRLRSGREHRKRITVSISGVLFDPAVYSVGQDPSESIQAQTHPKRLKIS